MTTKGTYAVKNGDDWNVRMQTAEGNGTDFGWSINELGSDTAYFAERMAQALISANERDSNQEPANVVDGLFAIARAINGLTEQLMRGGK